MIESSVELHAATRPEEIAMKLTKQERWMLSNQYRILELLDPQNASYHAEVRDAVESGYERHYAWATQYIYDDVVTDAEGQEVIDTLAMFSGLKRAYGSGIEGIDTDEVEFPGFDGNNETKQMAYALYFCKHDGGRSEPVNDFETPGGQRLKSNSLDWREALSWIDGFVDPRSGR